MDVRKTQKNGKTNHVNPMTTCNCNIKNNLRISVTVSP